MPSISGIFINDGIGMFFGLDLHSPGVGDRRRTHRVSGGGTESVCCSSSAEEGLRSIMCR